MVADVLMLAPDPARAGLLGIAFERSGWSLEAVSDLEGLWVRFQRGGRPRVVLCDAPSQVGAVADWLVTESGAEAPVPLIAIAAEAEAREHVDVLPERATPLRDVVALAQLVGSARRRVRLVRGEVLALLRGLAASGRTGVVRLRRFGPGWARRAEVRMWQGEPTRARAGDVTGRRALLRICTWQGAEVDYVEREVARTNEFREGAAALFERGRAHAEQWTALVASAVPENHILDIDPNALADRLRDIPDEVNSVTRLCDGTRCLATIVEESPYRDLDTAMILGKLVHLNVVTGRAPNATDEDSTLDLAGLMEARRRPLEPPVAPVDPSQLAPSRTAQEPAPDDHDDAEDGRTTTQKMWAFGPQGEPAPAALEWEGASPVGREPEPPTGPAPRRPSVAGLPIMPRGDEGQMSPPPTESEASPDSGTPEGGASELPSSAGIAALRPQVAATLFGRGRTVREEGGSPETVPSHALPLPPDEEPTTEFVPPPEAADEEPVEMAPLDLGEPATREEPSLPSAPTPLDPHESEDTDEFGSPPASSAPVELKPRVRPAAPSLDQLATGLERAFGESPPDTDEEYDAAEPFFHDAPPPDSDDEGLSAEHALGWLEHGILRALDAELGEVTPPDPALLMQRGGEVATRRDLVVPPVIVDASLWGDEGAALAEGGMARPTQAKRKPKPARRAPPPVPPAKATAATPPPTPATPARKPASPAAAPPSTPSQQATNSATKEVARIALKRVPAPPSPEPAAAPAPPTRNPLNPVDPPSREERFKTMERHFFDAGESLAEDEMDEDSFSDLDPKRRRR